MICQDRLGTKPRKVGKRWRVVAGGNNYGWTAGDDDTTKYASYACIEPVLQRPNEPTYSHIRKLYHVLHEHTAVLLGQVRNCLFPRTDCLVVETDQLSRQARDKLERTLRNDRFVQNPPSPTRWKQQDIGMRIGLDMRTYKNSTCSLAFVANLGDKPANYLSGITVPAHGTVLVSQQAAGAAPQLVFSTEVCPSSVPTLKRVSFACACP